MQDKYARLSAQDWAYSKQTLFAPVPTVVLSACLLHSQVKFFDPIIQEEREVRAGRMECTMQNLADSLTTRSSQALTGSAGGPLAQQQLTDQLSTFMVYNMRRKVRMMLMLLSSCLAAGLYNHPPANM